jgi:hypothetical protein
MTVDELADKLQSVHIPSSFYYEAGTMLRLLQLENEQQRKNYIDLFGKYQDALLELKFGIEK